mmetsp:Transcript_39867/g.87015  ORF Transcript_39867/g.87015 Transcript_39867/m.87015 type:complete len:120 (-) Transcript_39867:140-499(-)
MSLKDIPDRWKRFNPEKPPYMFFPGRTRKQTSILSGLALVVCTGIGFVFLQITEKHKRDHNKDEVYLEYARKNLTIDQEAQISNQAEAFRQIMLKARRERMGLPPQKHGSVDISDPFDS